MRESRCPGPDLFLEQGAGSNPDCSSGHRSPFLVDDQFLIRLGMSAYLEDDVGLTLEMPIEMGLVEVHRYFPVRFFPYLATV